jgi:hypothetical protein
VFVAHDGEVDDGLGEGLAGLVEPAFLGEVEVEDAGGGIDSIEDDADLFGVEGLVEEGVDGGGGGDLECGDVLKERDADFAVVADEGGVAVVAVVVAVGVAEGDLVAAACAVHFEVAALAVVGCWFGHGGSLERARGTVHSAQGTVRTAG